MRTTTIELRSTLESKYKAKRKPPSDTTQEEQNAQSHTPHKTNNQLVPDKKDRPCILWEMHDSPLAGHPGIEKTYKLLSQEYHQLSICGDVWKYIAGCEQCQ